MRLRSRLFTLLLALSLIVVPTVGAAQSALIVPPLSLLNGVLEAEYEWTITDDTTLVAQGSLVNVSASDATLTGLLIGFGSRKYMNGPALEGLYIGGNGQFVSITAQDSHEKVSISGLVLNGAAGYKINLGPSLLFDLSVNLLVPVYASASAAGESVSAFGTGGVTSRFGLGLGYAW